MRGKRRVMAVSAMMIPAALRTKDVFSREKAVPSDLRDRSRAKRRKTQLIPAIFLPQ
jgi:hypothetical protein